MKVRHDLAPFNDDTLSTKNRAIFLVRIETRVIDLTAQSDTLNLSKRELCFEFRDLEPENDLADLVHVAVPECWRNNCSDFSTIRDVCLGYAALEEPLRIVSARRSSSAIR